MFRGKSWTAVVLAGAWVFLACAIHAQPQFIRLRNEVIDTAKPERATTHHSTAIPDGTQTTQPATGLFLIQFNDHLQTAWRAELSTRHVELLSYVPDDAFVARLEGASLQELRALPFVRWVGSYRADHKLHNRLLDAAQARREAERLPVTVLLTPGAGLVETLATRRLFQSIDQQANHRFGSVLRGVVRGSALQSLADSPTVLWIEPGPRIKLYDQVAAEIVCGEGTGSGTFMQELGFDGAGVCVAVADSGLHTGTTNGMHADLLGRVKALLFYGALTDASDEHSHGTHVAGIVAGNGAVGEVDESGALYGLGVAPGASIVAQRIFDGVGEYEAPPSFEVLTHDAVRAGADIGSNSWGDDTQGRYDVSAAEFDALVRDADTDWSAPGDQQYVLEFSAGNAGSGIQTIGSPAVAKNVIATGASQNNRFDFVLYDEGQEAMADFSSRGPAEDGRIKPDVVAPGTWIASLQSASATDEYAWAPISPNYQYQGGTSQAGPHVSGAAAVFIQYYRETYASGSPSPALVKAALINSAVDMDDEFGTGPTPNMDEGWGRVDLTELIGSERAHEFVDQSTNLTTGRTYERHVIISSTEHPLKITLAYTDYPGFPAVLPALVNDLDLEVIAPDGRVYHGNQFNFGESVPDAPAFDNINNVECVHIAAPLAGDYVVRVIARNVVQDSRLDTPAPDQDFALVICGEILPPEAGIVLFDRGAYRAPAVAGIKLIDADLIGLPSALVIVRSATEPNGVLLLLNAQNGSGAFTGSVATALGTATSDNKIQIAHGDWIRADYFDLSDNVLRSAHAVGDMQPPLISQVSVTNQFGQTVVSWVTDEPADSVVRFDTSASLLRSASNAVITTQHQVELTNLIVGRTYYYRVESTDVAGNTAVANNGGMNFNFVAQPAATVLLVNNYIAAEGATFIPISSYTNALAEIGVSFDVTNVATAASMPGFNTLRPYPIVIWRVNDASLAGSAETIPAAQQAAIQQYINAGGSFFMASMEILSRLGPNSWFRTNVLHVSQFIFKPDQLSDCPTCDEDVGVPDIEGDDSDPVTRNILVTLDYSEYPDFFGLLGPDIADTFTPATNSTPILFSLVSGKPCGVRYPRTGQDSTGRVIFCSFPLDAIPVTGDAPNNRAAFLRNVIQFLAPGGLGTIALDHGEYHLPDLVTVEVADLDLAGQAAPQVTFHSDFDANAFVTVTLQETPQPGLFRGFVPLIAATEPPAAGRLRAAHGNRIYAEYFDASGSLTISAEADIDNAQPVITGITVTPGYDEAVISWSTDEPTDALVQFGESAFLSRAAYRPDLDFDHEVRVAGLVPDRLYYFQVVSRDSAGNTRVADNGGSFFAFRTLAPLHPPFFDDLESANSGWGVFSGEDSTSQWTLGSPNNGVETMAWSGVTCWGSSLLGDETDTIDTFLISPAIELTGGNVATLRFFHSYDFTEKNSFDIFEGGELLIFTNSVSSPVLLAEYYDGNFAWEEEEIDLTPFVGRVVFLVWHHQLFSLESAHRPGWLVDDVSVTMSNVPPVTIRVTNNLAQGRFILSGPISRAGQGLDTLITNAPPGTYTATFYSVPYYQTPSPQTNYIPSGGSVTFTGLYTIIDSDADGMPDAFELTHGGSSTGFDPAADKDGDGMSNLAEFLAGTNPTLPNSNLRITSHAVQTNGTLRLQWSTVPGCIYQVQGTLNFAGWTPLSTWIQATANTASFAQPLPGPGQPRNYRIAVRP